MRKQQSTYAFVAKLRNTSRLVLLTAACAIMSIAAGAQTYPSLAAGGKTDLKTDVSPVISYVPGEIAMAYRDSRTGNVGVSLSTDGLTWSTPVDTGVPTNDPIAALAADGVLRILVYTGGAYQYVTSTDGIHFTQPQPLSLSIGGRRLRPHFEPSLIWYDNNLYLSVVDTAPGSPDAVDVLVASYYDDPSSFSSLQWLSDIPTRSGASLLTINVPNSRFEALALAYTTGPGKHPVLREWLDYNNNQGYPDDFSVAIDTAARMDGTPHVIDFYPPGGSDEQNLYIFGRSAGDAHHLLAVDYDTPLLTGSPTFLPPQRYQQTLSGSPAVGEAGVNLLVAFRSKDGNKIQTYTAPYGGRQ